MRTVEEILDHHAQAVKDGNLDEIIADYADDAVLISKDTGPVKGKEALRGFFQMLTGGLFAGGESTDLVRIIDGELVYLEWQVESAKHVATGVDTFVVSGDRIRYQTGKLISFKRK